MGQEQNWPHILQGSFLPQRHTEEALLLLRRQRAGGSRGELCKPRALCQPQSTQTSDPPPTHRKAACSGQVVPRANCHPSLSSDLRTRLKCQLLAEPPLREGSGSDVHASGMNELPFPLLPRLSAARHGSGPARSSRPRPDSGGRWGAAGLGLCQRFLGPWDPGLDF